MSPLLIIALLGSVNIFAQAIEIKKENNFWKESSLEIKEEYQNSIELSKKDFRNYDKVSYTFSALNEGQQIDLDDSLTYKVLPNDTLMLIAFKIYGDYSKWRYLYNLNKETVPSNYDLKNVSYLKYSAPTSPYAKPQGKPYLIKRGDSLSLISRKVYGHFRHWRSIYENNPRQIKNPNLIFAGFTLYYPSLLLNNRLY